jgi:hypothetical protein
MKAFMEDRKKRETLALFLDFVLSLGLFRRACMDVLDKALAILKFPDSVHRRVDLIFAPYSVYWTAIVGWQVFQISIHARF